MKTDCFVFLLLIMEKFLSISCLRNCSASAATVQYVAACPVDETEYDKRAKSKGCFLIGQDCTKAEKFQYHCVLNSYGNASLEVCAPAWYLNGFCAEYNEEGTIIQDHYLKDCTEYGKPCPSRLLSTDTYKYPECYMYQRENLTMNRKRKKLLHLRTIILGTSSFILMVVIIGLITYRKFRNKYLKDTGNGITNENLAQDRELQSSEEWTNDEDTIPKDVTFDESYLEPRRNP